MHSIEIKEINRRFWIPENLGECSKKQYLDMSKLILMYQTEEISYEMFRVLGFYNLLNLEFSANEIEQIEDEKLQNIYIASEVLDSFFIVDEKGVKHLIQDYIHNPMKSVNYKLMSFYGPKDAFKNITWQQMIEGIGEVQNFLADGKVERLVTLFAMFYLRKKERLSDFDLDRRVAFFDHLDIRYVYGFYLLFVSFWKFLTSASVLQIDGKEVDLSLIFNQKTEMDQETELIDLGLRSTSHQIAESGVFGTMKELSNSNAWEILVNMYDIMVRNEKQKSTQEKEEL